MSNLFLALFLLSPIALLVGLIKPSLFSKFLPTRKKIGLAFGGLTILSFILFGVTAPPTEKKDEAKVENQQVQGEQTTAPEAPKPEDIAKVTRVIDGDTVELEDGKRVRLIGIDSSEKGNCYFQEATNKAKELLEGQEVTLEKDVSETDRYGRLLRYIWKGETLINEQLVKEGFASSYSYPPDVKYQDKFLVAQKDARDNNRGLWSSCPSQTSKPSAQPASTPAVKATVKPATQTQTSCQYSCSGPDRDCSDFSTHAQAQAFFGCCGFSASNDPMRLDKATGQGNGLACESLP
jgi:endonuclease YncB( thermonuclease family)